MRLFLLEATAQSSGSCGRLIAIVTTSFSSHLKGSGALHHAFDFLPLNFNDLPLVKPIAYSICIRQIFRRSDAPTVRDPNESFAA